MDVLCPYMFVSIQLCDYYLANWLANGVIPLGFSHKHIYDMVSIPNGNNFQILAFLE